MMNSNFQEITAQATGATEIFQIDIIQDLWSGYGKIARYGLKGCDRKTVVVKHVRMPDRTHHPRGWNTDWSHQRKIKSYEVEMAWYRTWSQFCDEHCRIPHCLALESGDDDGSEDWEIASSFILVSVSVSSSRAESLNFNH